MARLNSCTNSHVSSCIYIAEFVQRLKDPMAWPIIAFSALPPQHPTKPGQHAQLEGRHSRCHHLLPCLKVEGNGRRSKMIVTINKDHQRLTHTPSCTSPAYNKATALQILDNLTSWNHVQSLELQMNALPKCPDMPRCR